MDKKTKRVALGAALVSSLFSSCYLLSCWWSEFPGGSDWVLKHGALPVLEVFALALMYNIVRIGCALVGIALRIKTVDRARLASRAIFCGISVPIVSICMVLGAWIRR